MVKHLQTGFSVLLVSIVHKAFATKRKKNVFFITSVCKFFSYVVVFSHYFVAIKESNNIDA